MSAPSFVVLAQAFPPTGDAHHLRNVADATGRAALEFRFGGTTSNPTNERASSIHPRPPTAATVQFQNASLGKRVQDGSDLPFPLGCDASRDFVTRKKRSTTRQHRTNVFFAGALMCHVQHFLPVKHTAAHGCRATRVKGLECEIGITGNYLIKSADAYGAVHSRCA